MLGGAPAQGGRVAVAGWLEQSAVTALDLARRIVGRADVVALLVDPDDVEGLGRAMVIALSDTTLRENLRQRGYERARLFTWQRAALSTSALYRELCA